LVHAALAGYTDPAPGGKRDAGSADGGTSPVDGGKPTGDAGGTSRDGGAVDAAGGG